MVSPCGFKSHLPHHLNQKSHPLDGAFWFRSEGHLNPWIQVLRFALRSTSVGSDPTSTGRCEPVGAKRTSPGRSALRFATVGAKRTSPGRSAPHLPNIKSSSVWWAFLFIVAIFYNFHINFLLDIYISYSYNITCLRKCRNWQTSKTKDLVVVSPCGFKSHLPHHLNQKSHPLDGAFWFRSEGHLNPWIQVLRFALRSTSVGSNPTSTGRCEPVGAKRTSPGRSAPHLPYSLNKCFILWMGLFDLEAKGVVLQLMEVFYEI